ncbi:hypothetical protein Hanom_Chr17g01582711 [Helianthus anomalus]
MIWNPRSTTSLLYKISSNVAHKPLKTSTYTPEQNTIYKLGTKSVATTFEPNNRHSQLYQQAQNTNEPNNSSLSPIT